MDYGENGMKNNSGLNKENINNIFEEIIKLYYKNKLPIMNGIITKDEFIKINITENKVVLNKNDFDKNISLSEKDCSDINIFREIKYKNYTLLCGEGSYGGDGFIIIMNKDNKIIWVMFHDNINPIENIEIDNNKIIVINNCNIKYEFSINWDKI
jgi:hypothetical protein